MGFEVMKEEQKVEELVQTSVSERLKDRYLTVYVMGALLLPALNILSNALKPLLPSKKKKKGAVSEVSDKINTDFA